MQPVRKTEPESNSIILDLTVRNHPGVMSHICGLFSRRAFNVEGIFCMPVADGSFSRIWLLVNSDQRLDQVVKQVRKLHDVLQVDMHAGGDARFARLEEVFALEDGFHETG
ncbi:MAG: acetolactate synthase small subunit [Desulfovibrionales bacterium]